MIKTVNSNGKVTQVRQSATETVMVIIEPVHSVVFIPKNKILVLVEPT